MLDLRLLVLADKYGSKRRVSHCPADDKPSRSNRSELQQQRLTQERRMCNNTNDSGAGTFLRPFIQHAWRRRTAPGTENGRAAQGRQTNAQHMEEVLRVMASS